MAHTIAAALGTVKDDVAAHLSSQDVLQAADAIGHQWRDRLLGPVVTVYLFIEQILAGNTAMAHLRHLTGQPVKPSAYCQARQRLPLDLLRWLNRLVCGRMKDSVAEEGSRWCGLRTFLVDGSGVSMPDTPALRRHFGQPGEASVGCGFPVAMIAGLWHTATGMIQDLVVAPWKNQPMSHVRTLETSMGKGDLLVGDRGFCSYAHLAVLLRDGMHGLFRMHQKQIVDFRPHRRHAVRGGQEKGRPRSRWIKRLGVWDQVVRWQKPRRPPRWMNQQDYAQLPEEIEVRELRYRVRRRGFRVKMVTLVTTLLDGRKYPAEEIAKLYGRRWEVETNLRHLKQTLGMDVLKSKTVEGMMKELYVYIMVYNLVRMVMVRAGQRQGVPPERISFVDAWRWLRSATPDQELTDLIVNPHRQGRSEPRVRKRRPMNYRLMTRSRAELRKALGKTTCAA